MKKLHEFPVVTRSGYAVAVALGCVGLVLLTVWGIWEITGMPPVLDPWIKPCVFIGSPAMGVALALLRNRTTGLWIMRVTDDEHMLAVPLERVYLAFPLAISGDQMTHSIRGRRVYEVSLRLVDATGRGVFLRETRRATDGPQDRWLRVLDRNVVCEQFEAGRVGMLAELRAAVEALNVVTS